MRIFQLKNDLVELYENSFDQEKMIQNLVEQNLNSIFPDLKFVDTEFQIDDLRPDTIAFDLEKNSFVIIEYKKLESKSLIDQGVSYYQLLHQRKESFVLRYNKKMNKKFDISDINWDEARVIFISSAYTKFQRRASSFQGLPIELYVIKKYQKNIISLENVGTFNTRVTKSKNGNAKLPKSVPNTSEYVEEDYLIGKNVSDNTKKLWNKLKQIIENEFVDIEFRQKKVYGGYYLRDAGSSVCSLECTKNKIKVTYSTSDMKLLETNEFVHDVSNIGHHGIGNFSSVINDFDDITKILPLIKKVYNSKKTSKTRIIKPKNPKIKSHKRESTPSKYTEEEYLAGKYSSPCPTNEIKKLWNQLTNLIENTFHDIKFRQTKAYGCYDLQDTTSVICTLSVLKTKIHLVYSTSDMKLLEINEFVHDISNVGHHGIGNFRSVINDSNDIQKALPLIKKVYDSKKSK